MADLPNFPTIRMLVVSYEQDGQVKVFTDSGEIYNLEIIHLKHLESGAGDYEFSKLSDDFLEDSYVLGTFELLSDENSQLYFEAEKKILALKIKEANYEIQQTSDAARQLAEETANQKKQIEIFQARLAQLKTPE